MDRDLYDDIMHELMVNEHEAIRPPDSGAQMMPSREQAAYIRSIITRLQALAPPPALAITCDHQGWPGAIDPEDGEPHEYHCAACCPGACVGSSGEQGPCEMHKEGEAVSLLETPPMLPRAHAQPWTYGADVRGHTGIGFMGNTVTVDKAERIALDILRAVGAARRGDR